MLYSRAISVALLPASCSLINFTICSSVNLFFMIRSPCTFIISWRTIVANGSVYGEHVTWTGSLTCRRIIAGILLIVVFLPILGCWGYYFSAHAWANADAIMAILQTNFNEALSYIRDRTSFVMYIVLALSLVCWALLIKAVKHIRLKQGSWKYCVLVLIFALSNIMLLVRTRENFLTNIYTEAKEYQASYDEYAKKKEERKHNLSSINIEYSKRNGIYVLVIG